MRKIIAKDRAVRAAVLLIALILILLVYPVRILTTTLATSGGGTIISESDYINYEQSTLTQEFVAQYDRLSSVDIYVTKVEAGRYISIILFDENGADIFSAYVDTADFEIPGYVTVPAEIALEVGKKYYLRFQGCRSKYYVAFENVPDTPQYVGNLTENYANIEGLHVAAIYNYRLPLSKKASLGIIAGIILLAILICFISDRYYKKKPEKNNILTIGGVVRHVANPIAGVIFAALIVMVFPLKLFDSRPSDIIFYELGLLITAAIVFYAINHRSVKHEVGISFWQSLKNEDRLQYILIMLSMAMAIWYACEYMNGLYDIYHEISERKETFFLLLMTLLMFTRKEVINLYNLIWVAVSGIYGAHFYSLNRLPETEKEYDLHNTVLRFTIYSIILLGLILINFIRRAVTSLLRTKKGEKLKPTFFGIALTVLLILMIVFRNTRLWVIYLAVTFFCFFIKLALWEKNKDYYKILSGGLMLNFAISLVFCYLHRYFTGYVSGRFGFLFHTVTVTAEYFTFMGGAAAVMLLVKIVSLPKGTHLKDTFILAWKELVFFGFTMSYAIFTVSRTAYLAIIVTLFLIICVALLGSRKRLSAILVTFVLSLVVSFPAAFTLQRILPTMAADPVFYPIDDADSFARGGADWDSTNFMCVERFINLFGSKILGVDVGGFEYPIDKNNYKDDGRGEPLYDYYGRPYDESPDNPTNLPSEGGDESGCAYPEYARLLLASSTFTSAEFTILFDEMADYVDTTNSLDVISNGRITIFKAYIAELNMTGHETMGALLPNGEIALHAHNTYIQVAYDHGIPVGILFTAVLVMALICSVIRFLRSRDGEKLCLISCAVIIGFMVAGISEWVFHYSNPLTVAFMLAVAPLTYKAGER